MNLLNTILAIFSLVAVLDLILGNKLGLGKEFEKGIHIMGPLTLSMLGMIILAPAIAHVMEGVLNHLPCFLDPSIIPAMLFANDMGGAPLCTELGRDPQISAFNGLVVSSMMGCTVSFTIPFMMGVVAPKHREDTMFGMLWGIAAIPFGCFVSGILAGLSFPALILDLVPLFLFSCILVLGLLRFPAICIRIFTLFGILIQALVTIGLAVGIITFLTGIQLIPYCDTLENGIAVVLNIACVMTGIFPLLALLTKLLHKPLRTVGQKLRISDTATLGLISTLASSITTFHMVKDMDRRGIVLNAAFAVPAAFVLADHMAFTMAFYPDYLPYMMAGKMTAGILAVLLAMKFSGHRLKCTD